MVYQQPALPPLTRKAVLVVLLLKEEERHLCPSRGLLGFLVRTMQRATFLSKTAKLSAGTGDDRDERCCSD
jgi:hypothetical protein